MDASGKADSSEAARVAVSHSGPLDRDVTNALRVLTIDAIQKANSGHPGMPLGMAEIADVLWRQHLRHNPVNPKWYDRDRFVISNGHGSMLLYALLHLSGYDLPISELQRFRQLHSKTPGHPEVHVTPGVETTTGPLGQGIANAVGMALAERLLAQEFNRPGLEIVSHYTYVFLGDGCMMEGISHEACSLAGTLGLGKLIAFYDSNRVSIDGPVEGWFTDDTPKRFEAYGWHVLPAVDGHDKDAIHRAVNEAKSVLLQPTLICCRTIIGKGSPAKAGRREAHGGPLGVEEVAATRMNICWPHAPFVIPKEIYQAWDARAVGAQSEGTWNAMFERYSRLYPTEAAEFERRMNGRLPADMSERVRETLSAVRDKRDSVTSLKACQDAIEGLAVFLPELFGGAADFGPMPANPATWSGSRAVTRSCAGNYLHYGVREFGMAATMNGIALHGGFIPYGGAFLTFSDYCRNAIRIAALMGVRTIFMLVHDSISLGEDGPTHQPVEHLAALRVIPGLDVWRPCDTEESTVAWVAAIQRRDGPSCLVFGKKMLPFQRRPAAIAANIARGGYVLSDAEIKPRAVIIATGAEIALAVGAQERLKNSGIPVRVVSMPSTTVFDRQDTGYRRTVLPPNLPAVVVEPGVSDFWYKYIGLSGIVVGIDSFGTSGPSKEVFAWFGLTVERVVDAVVSVTSPPKPLAPL